MVVVQRLGWKLAKFLMRVRFPLTTPCLHRLMVRHLFRNNKVCYNRGMEKICSKCQQLKLHRMRGKYPHSYCPDCQKEYTNQHYADNKEKRKAQIRQSTKDRAQRYYSRVNEIKSSVGCTDCGEKDPIVLDFDHLGDKTENVSKMIYGSSWRAIETEIQKCEVVCANCHRKRTHIRRQNAVIV